MPTLTIDVPETLMRALRRRSEQSGHSVSDVALAMLTDSLALESETLFQVSTSAALVSGVFDGNVTIADLKAHGDLGLGTFDGLDGELIAFDGAFYQVRGNGEVRVPADAVEVPFALVTRFKAERQFELDPAGTLAELVTSLDRRRRTDNLFYAIRLDGHFTRIKTRSVFPADEGETLVAATADQKEFDLSDVAGTAVGFWTPAYARSIGVPGWHVHFLTDDRTAGGHVLDCEASSLRVQMQDLADVRLAMPETRAFLAADLSHDPSEALAVAESERHDS